MFHSVRKEGFLTLFRAQSRANFFQRNDNMKKLATLLLAAGMVVAASAPANAADIKVGGFHALTFEGQSNNYLGDNSEELLQRTRLNLTIAASENLKGFIEFQMGTDKWGDYAGKHSAAAKGDTALGDKHGRYNVQTRQAYFDWTVPGTAVKVRMGRSCFGLPAEAFGRNSVMDAGWGGRDGIIVTAPVADWLNLTALWARAHNDNSTDVDTSNNADVFGLVAAMKFNGFSITPYVAYASIDDGAAAGVGVSQVGDATLEMVWNKPTYTPESATANKETKGYYAPGVFAHDSNAYWGGVTATLSAFDPFTLKVSAAWGKQDFEGDAIVATTGAKVEDRSGWNVQAKASYKLGFGTPVLGAWYGSGDDNNEAFGRAGWMPSINGRFAATTDFHDGAWGLGGGVGTNNIAGTWGVQAGIEGVSFLADLTHDFKVTYIGGTNEEDLFKAVKGSNDLNPAKLGAYKGPYAYMTTEDSAVEFSLSNTYQIYKNLAANLELAYIINDFDEDLYTTKDGKKMYDEDDWRIGLTFQYNF